jgi:hypothetical protein
VDDERAGYVLGVEASEKTDASITRTESFITQRALARHIHRAANPGYIKLNSHDEDKANPSIPLPQHI